MLKVYRYSDSQNVIHAALSRNKMTPPEVVSAVADIIEQVRTQGDDALHHYTEQFDGISLDSFEFSMEEVVLTSKRVKMKNPVLYNALKLCAERIEDYHRNQLRTGFSYTSPRGSELGQRILPLDKVGIYVPGGTAAYPSSVLMNAIPARIAGVKDIVMVVPPRLLYGDSQEVKDAVLTAADLAGVTHIYAVGGAQAVAALAYGTATIPRVDKICGPGNIYVATAKKLVYGEVDIDMIAGPSEVLVIADDDANPAYVAADMLSQAEHDPMACSVLLCLSDRFADRVSQELERQLNLLDRRDIARPSIENYAFAVVCKDLQQATEFSNEYAPEHLEILTQNPKGLLPHIKNAGSVFLGKYSPEPLGDYIAGPNHVLPTSGSARFFSPLGVESYLKRTSYIYASKEDFFALREAAGTVAQVEGLTAHLASLTIRE